jgi:ATP-dependent DNA helicase RecG
MAFFFRYPSNEADDIGSDRTRQEIAWEMRKFAPTIDLASSPEEFRLKPHSEPINEIIAGALFRGGKAEGWGRGILNIFNYCQKAGMPEPKYEFVTNFVCLTIRFKTPLAPYVSDSLNEPLNEPLKGVVMQVYQLIVTRPGIKKVEIADSVDKSYASVKRYVKVLMDGDQVEYCDSNKTGGLYPVQK